MVRIDHFSRSINCEMYLKIELAMKISILYLARSSHPGTKVVLFYFVYNIKTLKMVWSTELQKLSQA